MTLRERIQKVIEDAPDSDQAATDVCVLLEDVIGLEGNGWFDDDEEVKNAIEAFYERVKELSDN